MQYLKKTFFCNFPQIYLADMNKWFINAEIVKKNNNWRIFGQKIPCKMVVKPDALALHSSLVHGTKFIKTF